MKKRKMRKLERLSGFTLVELILVVLIISIAAAIAIPMFASAADVQVRSAANQIAADLDYARGLAITRQKNYTVVFVPTTSPTGTSYYYLREAGGDIIDNPLTNQKYIVLYKPTTVASTIETYTVYPDSRVSGVRIDSVKDGLVDISAITFDYLGTPSLLTGPGWITLKSDTFVVYVKIEMMTGSVTITDTKG